MAHVIEQVGRIGATLGFAGLALLGVGARSAAPAVVAAPAAGAAAAPAPIVPLPAPHVIHGEAEQAYLQAVAAGDVDGDGATDLVLNHWSGRGMRRASHYVVALGRRDWPDVVALSKLDRQFDLGFPERLVDMLNDDTFEFRDVKDYDGDGVADIAVLYKERTMAETVAVELRVYRGGKNLAAIDVKSGRGDFGVRQGTVPRTAQQEKTLAMPDVVLSGDFDGDGDHDLAVASCAAGGQRYSDEQVGALRIYWSGPDGPKTVDLKRAGDTTIHGQPGLQMGCFSAAVADMDADGADDLVLFGSGLATFGGSHGAILYGRAVWPASAEVEDLADVRFDHDAPEGGLRIVRLVDANGDGRPDILAEYGTVRTVAGQCLWFGGPRATGRRTTDSCDLRFTGLPADHFVDVDADGRPDLVYAAHRPQGDTGPYAWRVRLGPLAAGSHALTGLADDGDLTFTQPITEAGMPDWRFEDVDGNGRADLVQSTVQALAPDGAELAGQVALHLGPLVDRAALPTAAPSPTATSRPGTPTPTPSPGGPTPTRPSPPPTGLAAATGVATAAAGGRIFLPVARTGREP